MVGGQIGQRLKDMSKKPLQTTLDDKNTHIFTDTERNTTLQKYNYKQKYRNTLKTKWWYPWHRNEGHVGKDHY